MTNSMPSCRPLCHIACLIEFPPSIAPSNSCCSGRAVEIPRNKQNGNGRSQEKDSGAQRESFQETHWKDRAHAEEVNDAAGLGRRV